MAVILFMFCYASTSGEGHVVHSTCTYSRVKLSWSLSNCVIHIPLKALVSVTYTCISTIYCNLGNIPPFYLHPLCPRCHQRIYLPLIPTVSGRIVCNCRGQNLHWVKITLNTVIKCVWIEIVLYDDFNLCIIKGFLFFFNVCFTVYWLRIYCKVVQCTCMYQNLFVITYVWIFALIHINFTGL